MRMWIFFVKWLKARLTYITKVKNRDKIAIKLAKCIIDITFIYSTTWEKVEWEINWLRMRNNW